MKPKKTIILFIIFLALLAYVYFFEIQGEKRKQVEKEKEEKVIDFDKDQISGLSFLTSGIIIEKENSHWKISSPVKTNADQSAVESILNSFDWLKKERFVSDNPTDFNQFGLSPYQSALAINHEGSSDTLFFGDNNLDNTKVFYRNSGSNNVYLVPKTLHVNASKSLYDLRDKSVLNFDKNEIIKIVIEKKQRVFSCLKDKDNKWWLEYPIKGFGDEDKIDDILNKLADTKVTQFISEKANNLKKYGLRTPWLAVSLFDSTQTKQMRLYVGNKEEKGYYAKDEARSSIFLVDSSFVVELDVTLFDLRDKTIVSFENDSVADLTIEYYDFTFHCVKDSSKKWWMTVPDSGLAKPWKISSLLYDIKNIEVARFLDKPVRSDNFYGFNKPLIKMILKSENKILADLIVGDEVNDYIYLKNNLTEEAYQVKANVKDKMTVNPQVFLEDGE